MDKAATVRPRVELIGTHLRAEGSVELGQFTRVSDYVNILSGFFNIHNVQLLTRTGEPTRVTFPEFRVRLDEIAVVGQHHPEENPAGAGPWGDVRMQAADTASVGAPRPTLLERHLMRDDLPFDDGGIDTTFNVPDVANPGAGRRVDKQQRRLVISTAAHIVYGYAHLHEEASMRAFLDASDPHFIPMTNVRVRWLADRRLAGRFPFALIQRTHIVGVASDVSEGMSTPMRRPAESPDPWGFERGGSEAG